MTVGCATRAPATQRLSIQHLALESAPISWLPQQVINPQGGAAGSRGVCQDFEDFSKNELSKSLFLCFSLRSLVHKSKSLPLKEK